MAEDKHAPTVHRAGSGPRIVTPTTRVNFAFPFSRITVDEPGRDLAELASIVAELATAVERAGTDPALAPVRDRAEALASRLH